MASQGSAGNVTRNQLSRRTSVIRFVPYQTNDNSQAKSGNEEECKSENLSGLQNLTRWVEQQNQCFRPGTSLDQHMLLSPSSSPDLIVD